MAQGVDERTGSGQLVGLRAALAHLFDEEQPVLSGREQLQELTEGLHLEAQLHTWLALLAGQVDAAEVAWQEHGTSTATWLADAANLTRREAGRLISASPDRGPEPRRMTPPELDEGPPAASTSSASVSVTKVARTRGGAVQ